MTSSALVSAFFAGHQVQTSSDLRPVGHRHQPLAKILGRLVVEPSKDAANALPGLLGVGRSHESDDLDVILLEESDEHLHA